MSTLYTDNIRANNASQITVPAGQTLYAPGHVLQVLQAHKSNTYSQTSASFTDITGLSISITPKSASSKILVMVRVSGQLWAAGHTYFRLVRDSTVIGDGDAAGSRTTCFSSTESNYEWATSDHSIQYLDSPSTASSVTYKVQGRAEYGTLTVNRSNRDLDSNADQRTSSQITVMEIAQ